MVKVTILAGRTQSERKEARQRVGTLRDNTVATKTRQRYHAALALQSFYFFCQTHRLRIPDEALTLDELFAEYIEHLWAEGFSMSKATDGLSGLQDLRPNLRGTLSLSWRLIKTWQRKEVPNRAPPLPEQLLQSLCGHFLSRDQPDMSLAHGVLRTGELFALKARHVNVAPCHEVAVLNLGLTKTSQRAGASDSVSLTVCPCANA